MLNKVILIGRLGKDPEIRQIESGVKVANFSLATDETFKDKSGEKKTHTEWHNLVLWRRQAEIAESYLRKGSLIYVEGRLRSRSWDDKDGNKKYITEILVDNFKMLGKREEQQEQVKVAQSTEPKSPVQNDDPGDLPF